MKQQVSFDRMPRKEHFLAVQKQESSNSKKIELLKKMVAEVSTKELTHRQLQVLDMYYYQRKTVEQIAKELGVHKSTVSKTKKRAIAKLEKYLSYYPFR